MAHAELVVEQECEIELSQELLEKLFLSSLPELLDISRLQKPSFSDAMEKIVGEILSDALQSNDNSDRNIVHDALRFSQTHDITVSITMKEIQKLIQKLSAEGKIIVSLEYFPEILISLAPEKTSTTKKKAKKK